MNNGWNFETFVNGARLAAQDLFGTIADVVGDKAESLRNGTEHDEVELPRDLAAHRDAQTEWWYYTGHAETSSGREFGFELVFFKRRTDLDSFSVIPLRLFGNPFYFAHFAITDIDNRQFRYSHRKSANGILDFPASMSEEHYYLRLGDWSVREAGAAHVLRATIDDDVVFEATLSPQKPVVLNGRNGVSFKDAGEASRYFSYTRLALEGDLTTGGETEHFRGSAWMDREFGTWKPTENQKGWDWFSVQLDNDTELMCYQLRSGAGEPSRFSSGTLVEPDGTHTALAYDAFSIDVLETWKSPNSGAEYPSRWRLKVPLRNLELEITPVLKDQELDTKGTTMIVYWEGSCRVSGRVGDGEVSGRAYVELVGYDRSHEDPNLARFLMGTSLDIVNRVIGK
ncbi:MAG: lipocalin family protein [Pyrinomonadaceae bacterium]